VHISMNMLLTVCGEYAAEVDVVCNTVKTIYIIIVTPKRYCNILCPTVKLNNMDLQMVNE
jgi:hypothetical protein